MAHAECGRHAHRDERQRQADREAQHPHDPERDLLELETEQENGDGCRARDQPAGEPEQHHLTGRDKAIGKPAANVVGMGARVGILAVAGGWVRTPRGGLADVRSSACRATASSRYGRF